MPASSVPRFTRDQNGSSALPPIAKIFGPPVVEPLLALLLEVAVPLAVEELVALLLQAAVASTVATTAVPTATRPRDERADLINKGGSLRELWPGRL